MFESGIYFQAKVHDIEYRHKILAEKSNDIHDMETLEEYESVRFNPQQNIGKFNINFAGLKFENFGSAFWYLLFGLIFSIICFVSEFYFI